MLEKQGKLLILAPDDIGKMKTLSKDRTQMEILYRKGYEDGELISFVDRSPRPCR